MSITTFDEWIASTKQHIPYSRTTARTTVANGWFTLHDVAGNPGAATLAVGNTANGAVPTDATNGFPAILFSSGVGYLSSVDFGNTVAGRLTLYDRLFHAGAYNFNDAITLTSQPGISSRIANSSYAGLQIWYEQVTAATGNQSIAVTYTNQAGTTGRTTGTVGLGTAPTVGRMFQLALQAGDTGVQKIESVTGTVASAGTFNIIIARPLWSARVGFTNGGDVHGPDRTGMPQLFADSALALMVNADSTSSGVPDLIVTVASA
jgi:hypothetical protein